MCIHTVTSVFPIFFKHFSNLSSIDLLISVKFKTTQIKGNNSGVVLFFFPVTVYCYTSKCRDNAVGFILSPLFRPWLLRHGSVCMYRRLGGKCL